MKHVPLLWRQDRRHGVAGGDQVLERFTGHSVKEHFRGVQVLLHTRAAD